MLVRNYNNNVVVINYFYVSEDIPAMGGQVPIPVLLMKFITARTRIPILGLEPKITIEYLMPSKNLADTNSCFHILKLPTKYAHDYVGFSNAMKATLRHDAVHLVIFSRPVWSTESQKTSHSPKTVC
jgi:uncharacterized membrane protein